VQKPLAYRLLKRRMSKRQIVERIKKGKARKAARALMTDPNGANGHSNGFPPFVISEAIRWRLSRRCHTASGLGC